MNLYFIRHGDPDYIHDSLTSKGQEQAKLLAETIHELNLDEIYQSPMGRAKQTAAYIAEKIGIEPKTVDWLHEICWGDMSGDAYSSASPWSLSDNFIHNDHYYPEGDNWKSHPLIKNDRLVEDLENHIKLFEEFLASEGFFRENQLYRVEKANNKNIAFVCHGGITESFTSHLLNIPFFQFIAHTTVECTSITKIAIDSEPGYQAARLIYINDQRHLGKR